MIDVALMVEGQDGLTWPRWKALAEAAESLGLAGLYRSDHFSNPDGPYKDALDPWISFAYLAATTERIEFGPMVSPVSFRNPIESAWRGAAVDDLSGGRFHMGLGAGWQEREHRAFGFDLLELKDRFVRFEEGVQVVKLLFESDEPVSFEGAYFRLDDALMLPRPSRAGGPPIVIGGNGEKRTMPLAARYADEWNAVFVTPDRFRELSGHLDRLLAAEGRTPEAMRRTVMHRVTVGATDADVKRKTEDVDVAELKSRGAMIGTPNDVAEGIQALGDAGAQRLMAQMYDLTDLDGVELLATRVLPQLS
ncbi:MAG: TIGR03560 family F420-dependent LLM class oxidoreductase [Thermomicrobiales bacterium]|nr:TIGR03560 family F420-dependent LLM class oxidoreductase [Thermomicrobiales bacterium]MCO5222378.1 TIGR03560 family F420-dependent LLM class oxidoreductase [Thermomicrobiales bacterium]